MIGRHKQKGTEQCSVSGCRMSCFVRVPDSAVRDIANECAVQDMPVGLHGSFPVLYQGVVILASGGIQAAYSQSQHALAYTL